MIYLDSTYIVKCYVNERARRTCCNWCSRIRGVDRACMAGWSFGRAFIGRYGRAILRQPTHSRCGHSFARMKTRGCDRRFGAPSVRRRGRVVRKRVHSFRRCAAFGLCEGTRVRRDLQQRPASVGSGAALWADRQECDSVIDRITILKFGREHVVQMNDREAGKHLGVIQTWAR